MSTASSKYTMHINVNDLRQQVQSIELDSLNYFEVPLVFTQFI